jgi:hypothetical protein
MRVDRTGGFFSGRRRGLGIVTEINQGLAAADSVFRCIEAKD